MAVVLLRQVPAEAGEGAEPLGDVLAVLLELLAAGGELFDENEEEAVEREEGQALQGVDDGDDHVRVGLHLFDSFDSETTEARGRQGPGRRNAEWSG